MDSRIRSQILDPSLGFESGEQVPNVSLLVLNSSIYIGKNGGTTHQKVDL